MPKGWGIEFSDPGLMGCVTSSKFAPLRLALGPPPEVVSPEGLGADFFGADLVL
jgi:hypothetical protein